MVVEAAGTNGPKWVTHEVMMKRIVSVAAKDAGPPDGFMEPVSGSPSVNNGFDDGKHQRRVTFIGGGNQQALKIVESVTDSIRDRIVRAERVNAFQEKPDPVPIFE